MRVLLADADFDDRAVERELLGQAGIELLDATRTKAPMKAPMADVHGLLVMWTRVDEPLLAAFPQLRVVGRYGIGVDSIDLDAAARRQVAVVTSGDYATEEVAIHTVALILGLLRRIMALDTAVRSGRWADQALLAPVRRLSTLRAGVIGLGNIGRRVARHLRDLGMDVAGYDPATPAPTVRTVSDLDELLGWADVVTLHAPLTPATAGLLDRRRLGLLRRGAVVVNAARGGLVDEDALADLAGSGHLGGVGLDVFSTEPVPAEHPLLSLSNVMVTPHVAYYSVEALVEARRRTVGAVVAALQGERPASLVL